MSEHVKIPIPKCFKEKHSSISLTELVQHGYLYPGTRLYFPHEDADCVLATIQKSENEQSYSISIGKNPDKESSKRKLEHARDPEWSNVKLLDSGESLASIRDRYLRDLISKKCLSLLHEAGAWDAQLSDDGETFVVSVESIERAHDIRCRGEDTLLRDRMLVIRQDKKPTLKSKTILGSPSPPSS